MSPHATSQHPGQPSRENVRVDPTRRWYHHPLVVIFVPLIVLVGFPHIYDALAATRSSSPFYNDVQLQQIASLMDDIYTTLANVTFIPHTSIKRGPHQINTTAISCKRAPAVLRLMEILPYVDPTQVEESDWLWGGSFMDYRRRGHIQDGCDPLRAEWWDYMTPDTIALTSWGTGGWNNDQTAVLLYDTGRHAMRIFTGEMFLRHHEYYDASGVGIFTDGIQASRTSLWDVDHYIHEEWFDAPTLLTRLRDAYMAPVWSPWETSYRENRWGIEPINTTTYMLRKNGWPKAFDVDQFRIDFIRTQNKPSGRGWAEAAMAEVERLEGKSELKRDWIPDGEIASDEQRLNGIRKRFSGATETEQWVSTWELERKTRDLAKKKAALQEAKQEVQRLCSNNVCVEEADIILWEFRAIEKEHAKSEVATNATAKCEAHMNKVNKSSPLDPTRFPNCVAQLQQKRHWLYLAYQQTRTEALAHCARTNQSLLPADTLEDRAARKIAEIETHIAAHKHVMQEMVDWQNDMNVPAVAAEAQRDWETGNAPLFQEEELRKVLERLADGGDKMSLWRHLESEDFVW